MNKKYFSREDRLAAKARLARERRKEKPMKWTREKRDTRYQHLYGITLAQYDAKLWGQNGGCALCGLAPKDQALCVDHNHTTGAVRGLLCRACNFLVGQLERPIMEAAKKYLSEWE